MFLTLDRYLFATLHYFIRDKYLSEENLFLAVALILGHPVCKVNTSLLSSA